MGLDVYKTGEVFFKNIYSCRKHVHTLVGHVLRPRKGLVIVRGPNARDSLVSQ